MKRIVIFFLVVLLMTGCVPSEQTDVEINNPDMNDTIPNTINTVPLIPDEPIENDISIPGKTESMSDDSNCIDTDEINRYEGMTQDELRAEFENLYKEMTYDELKAEFVINGVMARQTPVPEGSYIIFLYHMKCLIIFEKMLNYRQSLEDFAESVEFLLLFPYEIYTGYSLSIDIEPAITIGNTTYRVLQFSAHRWIDRMMYIQIYDDESITSQFVYSYMCEGGIHGEIIHCGFTQDSDKNYLIIIHKEYSPSIAFEYILVGFEIDGKEVQITKAYNKEFSKGIWTVTGKWHYIKDIPFTVITVPDEAYFPDFWWDIEDYNQEFFDDNIFTIVLNNNANDEISLKFNNGIWEVLD